VVTNVGYPGGGYQFLRSIGRFIVMAGAVLKGNSEIREMTSVGIQKYFQTTVRLSTPNISHERFILFFLARAPIFLKIV
jgi:CO dehydrogenase/acetyl-CoA synthase epsilon subunit